MTGNWPQFAADATLMEKLVGISRHYGADPAFILAGGGNTSAKSDDTLWVKASGFELATITAEGFVALDRRKLDALLAADMPGDAVERENRFVAGVMAARVDASQAHRPSVESLLHNLMPQRLVVHTHCALINGLACCERGREALKQALGERVLWIDFVEPGYRLAKTIAAELAKYSHTHGGAMPEGIVLQNHGLLVGGQEPEEIRDRTASILSAVRERVGDRRAAGAFGEVSRMGADDARRLVNVIAPALRGLTGDGPRLEVVCFDDSDTVMALAGASDGRAITEHGALMPDQIAYAGPFPMWFDPPAGASDADIVEQLRRTVEAYKSLRKVMPQIVLVRGLGMFAAGSDWSAADRARAVYANTIEVMAMAHRLGGIHVLEDRHREFIEGWEIEAYRKRIARTGASGRAAGKIALVTGAAQGFGLEIAQDLAAQGACVALADVNEQGALQAADELVRRHGRGRAMAIVVNVTSAQSVRQAIDAMVRAYGGLDLLVSNAGVLRAQSVKTQPEKDFDFVTAVNYKGYFVCVQQAAPVMAVQHMARKNALSDIIQINSKSGLQGSRANFAYAGSKFGGIGLTQSFAMELVDDGIKVNAICPGNFFDGPLWSDPDNGLFVQYLRAGKVNGARTVADVKRAYEAKVPMGRGCSAPDVMKAIYYLMEQQYETGQALPVTGGQVMLS